MINNKGQVLVCFVLLIPIIFLLLFLIINLGLFSIEKRKMSNTIKSSITYGLRHIDEENIEGTLKELIKKNIDEIEELTVLVDNGYINIRISKNYKALFKHFNNEKITLSYTGNIIENKIIIKED